MECRKGKKGSIEADIARTQKGRRERCEDEVVGEGGRDREAGRKRLREEGKV